MKRSDQADSKPQARAEGLVVQELADELLVYDLETHESHCLNRTAALVWRRCDGQTDVREITRRVATELASPVDEQVTWYALKQLERRSLLRAPLPQLSAQARISRRALIRRVGLTLVLIPAITSITAPTAYAAVSCTGACPNGNECAPNCVCVNGNCVPA